MRRPAHRTVVAYLALFVAMGGTAVAATGGNFILGQSNSADTTTTVASTRSGPALQPASSAPSTAPFSVSGNSTLVGSLSANFVGGLGVGSLQRRVTGACTNRQAIKTI